MPQIKSIASLSPDHAQRAKQLLDTLMAKHGKAFPIGAMLANVTTLTNAMCHADDPQERHEFHDMLSREHSALITAAALLSGVPVASVIVVADALKQFEDGLDMEAKLDELEPALDGTADAAKGVLAKAGGAG